MSDLKTQRNDGDVVQFLQSVENQRRKEDAFTILDLMKEVIGEEPKMWGKSIIGYGEYHYKYESGREGDWFLAGFSPRKQNLTLYIMDGFAEYDDLMSKLGKHKTGKSCLYINKLADVDLGVLKELVAKSVAHMAETNPSSMNNQ
jgi:hypothetical protein